MDTHASNLPRPENRALYELRSIAGVGNHGGGGDVRAVAGTSAREMRLAHWLARSYRRAVAVT